MECIDCNVEFMDNASFINHLIKNRKCMEVKGYHICEFCEKIFKEKLYLDSHMKSSKACLKLANYIANMPIIINCIRKEIEEEYERQIKDLIDKI
jgi:ADP-glucose pyrophosphorylase